MATNLQYLEDKIREQNTLISQYKANILSLTQQKAELNKKLQAELFYYSSLGPLQVSKKRTSEAKQQAIKNEMAGIDLKIKANEDLIKQAQNKIAQYEQSIANYQNALNEGLSAGMSESEAQNRANTSIQGDVNAIQGADDAQAQADANKRMIKNLLMVFGLVILVALVIYFVRKNKKGAKK